MKRHLTLIGMMGSGKSTLAELIAKDLGFGFVDTDQQIQTASGMSVQEYFVQRGESAFRDAEEAAVREAMTSNDSCVVAVGGGAILREDNQRLLLQHSWVVWLRASTETLLERLGDGRGRPLLAGDVQEVITRLQDERADLYVASADMAVDVDDHDVESLVFALTSLYKDVTSK